VTRDPGGPLAGEPLVVHTRGELAQALAELRQNARGTNGAGPRLALVPTMGALHPGHLTLLEQARERADHVVLSVFVNPLQFGPGEDLDRYPRTLASDVAGAAREGVSLVFAPSVATMYPDGIPLVRVVPGPMGETLCGATRPGHFEGVLTVVARLFGLVRPEVAVFGRKDAQQAALIQRMVRDLALGVEVEVAPLVREADGLAMSSRNAYLTSGERAVAPAIFQALEEAGAAFAAGERDPDRLATAFRWALQERGGDAFRLEYALVVDPLTLAPPVEAGPRDLLAVAAHLGRTRLLDNVILGDPSGDPRISRPPESPGPDAPRSRSPGEGAP
jgi:pantoate--beta-alanine ligase